MRVTSARRQRDDGWASLTIEEKHTVCAHVTIARNSHSPQKRGREAVVCQISMCARDAGELGRTAADESGRQREKQNFTARKGSQSMHLVATSSCSWAPRSEEETNSAAAILPREEPPSPLTTPRMRPPRQLVLIGPALLSARFSPPRSLRFFPPSFFFYRLSPSTARIRRAQRWFSWPTGTD